VEDHDAGEGLGGVGGGRVEARSVDLSHDGGGVIANVSGRAVILIGGDGSNIENAVTKGTERDR